MQAEGGVDAMWRAYASYSLGRAEPKLNSPFWRGFRAINSTITGCEDSALWTNVFKVNVRGSVMRNCTARELNALRLVQSGLLRDELAILQPDIVIFLSGPRYDSTLRCDFPDVEFLPLRRGLSTTTAGIVRASGLPSRSIRTYHPEYLQRSNQLQVLSDIARWVTTG